MNKRLLVILSIVVLAIAVAGAIIIWTSVRSRAPLPKAPTPAGAPLSGFPVPPPTTNPPPPAPPASPNRDDPPTTIPTNPETNSTSTSSTHNQTTSGPLIKLSPTAVSGAVLTPRISSTTPATLIYIEESTGNLFRVAPDGQSNQRLTNSALPGIARSWWGIYKNTVTLLAQYLDNQEAPVTFRGTYKLEGTVPAELLGGPISKVIAGGIAISPSRDRFFSLLDAGAGVIGTVTELASGKVKNVFTSLFKSWSVSWPAPTIIALIPRAAAGVPGTLYFLNTNTGALTRVLGGPTGLTTLVNQTGARILYNQELGDLKLFSPRDGSTRSLTVTTLPEKCVWASDAVTIYCAVPNTLPSAETGQAPIQYPDSWWSGEATFNDSFWKINTATGEGKIVYTNGATGSGNHLDAINLILDETGQRLIFTDRWSAILWSLDLH